MTTMTDDRRVRAAVASPARYFYFHMALACAAVAFLGFAPTYFVPLASGSLAVPPAVHIHGVVFFTWSVFFVFQAWLASSGQIAHPAIRQRAAERRGERDVPGVEIHHLRQHYHIGVRVVGVQIEHGHARAQPHPVGRRLGVGKLAQLVQALVELAQEPELQARQAD